MSDKDRAKMSVHEFVGEGDECDACGLSKRNTVHPNPNRPHPPGEGYSYQQAKEKEQNKTESPSAGEGARVTNVRLKDTA